MQWNARELAWAKQHGVNLGQKTQGGLSTNADYQRITGQVPGGGGGGGGGAQPLARGIQRTDQPLPTSAAGQIRVGNRMFDPRQMFEVEINSVNHPVRVNAAQAAAIAGGRGFGSGNWIDFGGGQQAGHYQFLRILDEPPPLSVAAPAPAPSGGGGRRRRAAPAPAAPAAPAPAPSPGKNEISPPASGLEDTIVGGKLPPSYLYPERTKKKYLSGLRNSKDEETGARGSFLTRAG
jgi:hypothetical protein